MPSVVSANFGKGGVPVHIIGNDFEFAYTEKTFSFHLEKLHLSDLTRWEKIDEQKKRKLSSTLGWGFAIGALTGGLGLVLGGWLGGKNKKKEYLIACEFGPEKKLIMKLGEKDMQKFITYCPISEAQDIPQEEDNVSSISDALLKLKQLKDSGIITEAEYEEKRKTLVEKL